MNKKLIYALLAVAAFACSPAGSSGLQAQDAPKAKVAQGASTLPSIFPAPHAAKLIGPAQALGTKVTLVSLQGVSDFTRSRVEKFLSQAGVKDISRVTKMPKSPKGTLVVLTAANNQQANILLEKAGGKPTDKKEGYVIASAQDGDAFIITLAGADADGLFHASQTFGQLAAADAFASLLIEDYPLQPIRGTIEGFYGKPWTMKERESHLNFLASVKANTYVYTPKDDPYARDKWREPYPADTLAELGRIAKISSDNHINFVYAISPGPTICFSCQADFEHLKDKVDALRSVGVKSFYVALDDIEYQKWNCQQDSITYGKSGAEAAAIAQSDILNKLQDYIQSVEPEAPNLIMVPTEYYDAKESPYKAALRKHLNKDIVVQWTGTDVVPPSISINDAKAATKAFGKPTLLWDNYPVNDYSESKGRLLLAPYVRREAGLSGHLEGILSNPMNQEAASRVAVTGVTAFAWNDSTYDASRVWRFAARELAGNDPEATEALLLFFDTQHLAPTFGTHPWQVQSPALKLVLDGLRDALAYGDKGLIEKKMDEVLAHSKSFKQAPAIIRSGKVDKGFVAESGPWLDAMALWGEALELTTLGLKQSYSGADHTATEALFDKAGELSKQAKAIPSTPGATRFEGPVKIADGVLDAFIRDARGLIYSRK